MIVGRYFTKEHTYLDGKLGCLVSKAIVLYNCKIAVSR